MSIENLQGQQPPYSVEVEQTLLGALLLDNAAYDRITSIVTADDFYRDDHRRIFQAISRQLDHGHAADVITVSEALDTANDLQYVGGLAYLGSLAQNTPSSANIHRYAELVREKSILRQLAAATVQIAEKVYRPAGADVKTILDQAEAAVFQISEQAKQGGGSGFQTMTPLLKTMVKGIEEQLNRNDDSPITGVATGYDDLDRLTFGLQPSDLIIIAGRPSMGKTAFAINIGEHVALKQGLPVAIFSMEMGADQLTKRMAASVGQIDSHKLKTGRLDHEDWSRLGAAISQLSSAPLFIDEEPALTTLDIRSRCRKLARQFQGPLGLVIIDYLQLMAAVNSDGREQNRSLELGQMTRSLKALAKELKVPVVVLSQLSRAVEQRTDKRPMMSDLRESGAIEQDADLIMFMYRDDYYNPDSPHKGMAECIIGKHRNGPTGRVPLVFRGEISRFESAKGWPAVSV